MKRLPAIAAVAVGSTWLTCAPRPFRIRGDVATDIAHCGQGTIALSFHGWWEAART